MIHRTSPFFRLPRSHVAAARALLAASIVAACHASARAADIPLEKLETPAAAAGVVASHPVLAREVPGVTTDWLTIAGPARHLEAGTEAQEIVWLVLGGRGVLRTGGKEFPIAEESIARAPVGWAWEIEAPAGETLLCLRIRKEISDEDRQEYPKFPENNREAWVRKFSECTPYGEAIKSAQTVSRTLLPKDFVPRMSVGTVETLGPDRVGRHQHAMLEQLFVGLRDNDCFVSADDARVAFPPLSILHIPLGSMHGAEVEAGRKLYYVWMDFFTTKAGEEWLKMHKPVQETPAKP